MKKCNILFLLYSIVIITMVVVLYYGGVHFNYILDDSIVFDQNSFVKKGIDGFSSILSTDSFQGYFGEQKMLVEGGRYRPLSLLTFALEYELWGLNPTLSHIINILFYGICGVLLFIFSEKLIQKHSDKLPEIWRDYQIFGFVVAILFIAHPIHSEAVANIKGRDEILTLILGIAGVLVAIQSMKKQQPIYLATLTGVLLFLASMSKENAITFLAIIPLTLYFLEASKKIIVWNTLSAFIGIGLYLLVRHNVLGYTLNSEEITNPMNNSFYGMTTMEYWATIGYTLSRYLELLFFPHPLSHDYYPYAIPNATFGYLRSWVGLIGYGIISIFAIWRMRKNPYLPAYSILFYLITFSIVSNVFFSIGTFMNERFIFIPSVGFALLSAWCIVYFWQNVHKALAIGIFVSIVSFYGWKTIDRVPDWENNMTLNRSAIEASPRSARANLFMGTAIYKEISSSMTKDKKNQLLLEASSYIDESLNIWSKYGNNKTRDYNYPDAMNMKAGIAGQLHTYGYLSDEQLLHQFEYVLRRKPDVNYVREYMDYVDEQINPELLLPWYKKIGGVVIPQYAERVNHNYYKVALVYLGFGMEISKYDPELLNYTSKAYKKIGNQAESEAFRERAKLYSNSN